MQKSKKGNLAQSHQMANGNSLNESRFSFTLRCMLFFFLVFFLDFCKSIGDYFRGIAFHFYLVSHTYLFLGPWITPQASRFLKLFGAFAYASPHKWFIS